MTISVHFSEDELSCKCGCGMLIVQTSLVGLLEAIRARFMAPVYITSCNRCEAHNAACGGVQNSFHMQGIAADIFLEGVPLEQIAQAARDVGAGGVGIYWGQGFVHVDTRTLFGYPYSEWEE